MIRLLAALVPALRSAFRTRYDLVLENLALRQQVATLASRHRPSLRPADRAFWVALRRLWPGWARVLVIVQPDTVIRWHRTGFRLYWARLSRRARRAGRPTLSREVRSLIRRIATENFWGAPRASTESSALSVSTSPSAAFPAAYRLPPRRPGQSWKTFLETIGKASRPWIRVRRVRRDLREALVQMRSPRYP